MKRTLLIYLSFILLSGLFFYILFIHYEPKVNLEVIERSTPYFLIMTTTLLGFTGTIGVYYLNSCQSNIENFNRVIQQIIFKEFEYRDKKQENELLEILKGLEERIIKRRDFQIKEKSEFKILLFVTVIVFVFAILFEVLLLASIMGDPGLIPYFGVFSAWLITSSVEGFFCILYEAG